LISLLVSDFKDQCGSVPSISVAVLGQEFYTPSNTCFDSKNMKINILNNRK
jgi:hypothetical protein